MIYYFEIYLVICTLFLAGKDATSFLMKEKATDELLLTRLQHWHRDGVLLYMLFCIPVLFWGSTINHLALQYKLIPAVLLIRLSLYDVFFNKWAMLPLKQLGTTAFWDIFFTRIFKKNGAIKKILLFFFLLLVLNFFFIIHKL